MNATHHDCVQDYLARLQRVALVLPLGERQDVLSQISDHIDEALAAAPEQPEPSEAKVRQMLESLGSPEEVVAAFAAMSPQPSGPELAPGASAAVPRVATREKTALILLGLSVLGWFPHPYLLFLALGLWVAGASLMVRSTLCSRTDKALGLLGFGLPLLYGTLWFALMVLSQQKAGDLSALNAASAVVIGQLVSLVISPVLLTLTARRLIRHARTTAKVAVRTRTKETPVGP